MTVEDKTGVSPSKKLDSPKKLRFFVYYFALLILPGLIIAVIFGSQATGIGNASTGSSAVRVGSELDFPPYAMVDKNGQPEGFSLDLIKAVAEAMGLSIKISTGPWNAVWKALVARRLDVLPIVAKSPERQRLVDFSLPHTETYDAFFVRQGSPPIADIEAAKGKEIVVMRSDAAHHALVERHFRGRLILVETIPAGLALISSGKYDAFLCSKLIGTMVIREHGLRNLTSGPPIPDYKRVFSFAVKKGDVELLEKLNQGLLIIKTNGTYNRIYEKWLTADDPWRQWEKYLWPAIAVVIFIVLIAAVWLVMLQLLVKKRTSELRLAQEELEERVTQRTAELARTNDSLRESEERLRLFIEHAPVSLAMFDKKMRYLSASRRWRGDYNLGDHDLLGQSHYEIFRDLPERWKEVHRRCLAGEVVQVDADHFERADGLVQWLRWEVRPWYGASGEVAGIVIFTEDITERRKMMEGLQERTAELEQANRELESFSYSVSHDLKSPLRAIQGFSRMLLEEHTAGLDEEGRRLLQVVIDNTQLMDRLINDLLNLARLAREPIRKESVDLTAIAQGIFEGLRSQEPDRDLRLIINESPLALGDNHLLQHLLANLLENAVKFTRTKKPAVIEVGGRTEGGENIYYVKDNGVGFDENYAHNLFLVFKRLHSGQEYEGTGVGLATVQRIIQRHGGRVWAEGKVGEGATFYFSLPKNGE